MNLSQKFRDAPVKRKLMLIGLLTSGLALLFISLILSSETWIEERARAVTNMTTYAEVIGMNVAPALLFDDQNAAAETLSALAANPDIVDAVIFDKTGKTFARFIVPQHSINVPMPVIESGSHLFSFNQLVVLEPIRFKGEVVGSVYLESDLRGLYVDILEDIALTFAAALGVFLASLFLFARLQKFIADPILDLSDGMGKVTAGQDYAVRVSVHGKDEVGMLAHTFNTMLDGIQQRDEELAHHRELLEETVAQRTASLTDAQRLTVQIIETIPLRVFWKDRDLRYLGCNTQLAKDAGLTRPEELIGKNDFDMGWKEQAELYRADDKEVMDSNTPKLSYDELQTTPDGGSIWLRTSKVPLRNEVDEVFGMLGVYEDITEYKKVELRLQESEERFRKAFENSAIGMALVGLDGRWLKVNASLCRIVGYPEAELLGKTFQDITHPDDMETDLDYVAQLLAGEIDHYQMEKRYFHKDGHTVWVLLSVSLIRDAQNKPVHFVSQIEDITAQRLAEESIRKMNVELEEKVRERTRQLLEAQEELVRKEKLAVLGQVAGSVGHELRNPLGVMSNAVYFLQTVLSDADDIIREYLNIIKDEIAGSERIVSDLLDAVRTKPPHQETVGIKELLDQTLRKYIVPASVSVKLDMPETLPPLRVDAMQIHQVLRNLISNGVEAMPDGGTLEISAIANTQDQTVRVSVRDSGSGMTPEVMEKLFQPLFTTKARGIGLGLVVVKNLTQANGGKVEVQSEPGKGAVFIVTLPATDTERDSS